MSRKVIAGCVGAWMAGVVMGGGLLWLACVRGWINEKHAEAGGSGSAEGGEHAGHEEHNEGSDGGHGDSEVVSLSEEVMREFGIEVVTAGPGRLHETVVLPGEVQANQDRLAHIVPRVTGIVRDVGVGLGEDVEAGEVMVVLESRELAEAKAAYLAARQRLALAEANLAANEELHAKGVVSDLEFLEARRELADAQIEARASERRLYALGLTAEEIAGVEREGEERFAMYVLRAPFAGTVIEKHVALGEVVGPESTLYVLADLQDVWVMLTVYKKDLPRVRVGQVVTVRSREGGLTARGRIDYVSPTVEEATRTATARVVIGNPEHLWRPGLFITGVVEVGAKEVAVLVPLSALQEIEGRTCVFVLTPEGFVPRPVRVGRRDERAAEVVAGLRPGERYAASGAFALKSELLKASFAGEGHAH